MEGRTRDDLIEEFEQSRSLSLTIYKVETREIVKNTEVIIDGSIFLKDYKPKEQKIQVVNKGTIETSLGVISEGRVAALNFADPYKEGGLVWDGESTQEECLCRCTSLYETLIKQECWEQYYRYNRSLDNNIFSDRCIYSPEVIIYKDENYNYAPWAPRFDVISCPAPVCCNDIKVFEKRIKCILGAAYSHGVETLILGAWGAGAFGNDPALVATAFKNVLDEYKLFDKVIFAIICTDGIPDNNYEVFKNVLGAT